MAKPRPKSAAKAKPVVEEVSIDAFPVGVKSLFPIRKGSKGFGLIDRHGRTLVSPAFSQVSKGFANASIVSYDYFVGQDRVLLLSRDAWYYCHEGGAERVEPTVSIFSIRFAYNVGDGLFALMPTDRDNRYRAMVVDPESKWRPTESFQLAPMARMNSGRVPIQVGEKYGYADRTGRIVIEPKYQDAEAYFGDPPRAPVCLDDRWGYLDLDGNVAVPIQYKGVSAWFDQGMALVWKHDRPRSFFIDVDGAELREFPLSWHMPNACFDGFAQGRLYFRGPDLADPRMGGGFVLQFGVIDTDGNWVVEPNRGMSGVGASFWPGHAILNRWSEGQFAEEACFIYGIDGKVVSKLPRRDVKQWNGFSYGLACDRDCKVGYVDTNGNRPGVP
ncbi:WG repeat-containing protein [Rosistilla carotiformis]|uniref:WG repeat-containing protein n=1 Tax=Rosistilla carotiformis TaxID=2528017 RepID=UPI0018D25A5D|nr:WG repeat-containing protein [Rosistilla carotiformis]